MAVTIQLGGVDISADLPLYGQGFQVIRDNDQGEGYIRYGITLAGFLESSEGHEAVRELYDELRTKVDNKNRTTFTYIDGDTEIHNDRLVYVESFTEPTDNEYAKQEIGDYSISLYYFGDAINGAPPASQTPDIACTYGAYNFEKTPSWGRRFDINRPHYRARLNTDTGKTGVITLTGFLFSSSGNSEDMQAKIELLQNAFNEDRTLVYGAFNQSCRTGGCEVPSVFPLHYAPYKITLYYDVGQYFNLQTRIRYSRIHYNPVITEEPGCDRRQIELMNRSGQPISYSYYVEAPTISQAQTILAQEALATVIPGGIELPGGEEEQNSDIASISLSFTKFYETPVLLNMANT